MGENQLAGTVGRHCAAWVRIFGGTVGSSPWWNHDFERYSGESGQYTTKLEREKINLSIYEKFRKNVNRFLWGSSLNRCNEMMEETLWTVCCILYLQF